MRVIVTGGAGFIGCNLIKELKNLGHYVVAIDNLSTGTEKNIEWCKPDKFHLEDFTSYISMSNVIISREKFDILFHVGALPRVQFSIQKPLKTNRSNIEGTLCLLEIARKLKIKRFVYSSSSSVYGDQSILPLKEDMTPNPMSPYALQKLVGEYYCKLYYDLHGIETISLRYFNVFGNRQSPEGSYATLIPKFIDFMKRGIQPVIHGDGKQTRDFTSVDDVVKANILASTIDNTECFGESFNIGNGKSKSVNDVTKILKKVLKSDIEPIYGEPVVEPKHTLADNIKAKDMLGWEPKSDFNEVISKMI